MELTAQTLREVEFREKLRGYHPDDVDDFLEEAAVALDDLLERLRVAESGRGGEALGGPSGGARPSQEATGPIPLVRADPAPAPPTPSAEASSAASPATPAGTEGQRAPAPQGASSVTEETLRRTLVLAQQTADAAIADAQESAKRIVDEAQAEARRLTETAEARAAEVRAQAQARAAQSMAELEEQRSGLEHEVVALRSWAVQQRDRLRDALTDQVRSLDIWLATSAPSSAAVGPKADLPGDDHGHPQAGPDNAARADGPDGPRPAEAAGLGGASPEKSSGASPEKSSGEGAMATETRPTATPDPDGPRSPEPTDRAPSTRSTRAPFSAAPSTRVPPLSVEPPAGAPSRSGLVDHEAEPGWVEEGPAPEESGGDNSASDDERPPRGFFRGR